ncbi:hypothetical protein ACHHYP_04943 [Achlya hypogyna]|uniref:Uncharacterized protein n=1 Tax=Achlya hypogyna TaxID=1202772 RepID=A0A1V9ZNX0_ACHHY|nr:hypothetical protein ACHHYP_04943 [Achlya hypogyna]
MTATTAARSTSAVEPAVDVKVVGAIAANVWAETFFPSEELSVNFLEFQKGKCLAETSAGVGYLLCAFSDGKAPMGLLKKKLETLQPYLKKRCKRSRSNLRNQAR